MTSWTTLCTEQYYFVRESRGVLLDYCSRIRPDDLLNSQSAFGRGGSIRNLLVHMANTYEYWIAHIALGTKADFTPYDLIQSHLDIVRLFQDIDLLMHRFFTQMEERDWADLNVEIRGMRQPTSPFRLFSHVVTHEFHHKGQVLSLSRQLGYTPVDTDIMR